MGFNLGGFLKGLYDDINIFDNGKSHGNPTGAPKPPPASTAQPQQQQRPQVASVQRPAPKPLWQQILNGAEGVAGGAAKALIPGVQQFQDMRKGIQEVAKSPTVQAAQASPIQGVRDYGNWAAQQGKPIDSGKIYNDIGGAAVNSQPGQAVANLPGVRPVASFLNQNIVQPNIQTISRVSLAGQGADSYAPGWKGVGQGLQDVANIGSAVYAPVKGAGLAARFAANALPGVVTSTGQNLAEGNRNVVDIAKDATLSGLATGTLGEAFHGVGAIANKFRAPAAVENAVSQTPTVTTKLASPIRGEGGRFNGSTPGTPTTKLVKNTGGTQRAISQAELDTYNATGQLPANPEGYTNLIKPGQLDNIKGIGNDKKYLVTFRDGVPIDSQAGPQLAVKGGIGREHVAQIEPFVKKPTAQDLMNQEKSNSISRSFKEFMNAEGGYVGLPGKKDPLEALKAEARNYKSADEFVKAQGEPVYHGTTEKINGDYKYPLYTTPKKDYAQVFADSSSASSIGKSGQKLKDASMVHEFAVNPRARVMDIHDPAVKDLLNKEYFGKYSTSDKFYPGKNGHLDWTEGQNLAEFIQEKKLPFDAIKLDEGGAGIDPGSGLKVIDKGVSYLALNKDALRSKSQLTDIYNQAQSKPISKSFKDFINNEDGHIALPGGKEPSFEETMNNNKVNAAKELPDLVKKAKSPEGLNSIINGHHLSVMEDYASPKTKAIMAGHDGGYNPNSEYYQEQVVKDYYNYTKGGKRPTSSPKSDLQPSPGLSQIERTGSETPQLPGIGQKNSYVDSTTPTTNVKLNTARLDVAPEEAKAIGQQTSEVVDRLSNKEVQDIAVNSGIDTRSYTSDQTRKKIAEQLNLRQETVSIAKRAEQARLAGNTDEAAALIRQAAERGGIARAQGTDLARQLQARSIVADELASPEQRLFKLLDTAGVNPDVYSKRLATVDFNDANQVIKAYRDLVPAKFGDWIDVVRYNSMLSSPLTQIVNVASTAGNIAMAPLEKGITGTINHLTSALGLTERKYASGEGRAFAKGALTSFPQALTEFKRTLKGMDANLNVDVGQGGFVPVKAHGDSAVHDILSFPGALLGAFDNLNRTLVSGGSDAALAKRAAAGFKTGDIASQGVREAAYRTFNAPLGDKSQGGLLRGIDEITGLVMKARSSKNPVVKWPAKLTLPFVRIGTNLMKQGIEYGPAGLATIPGALNKDEQLTKALMGTAVFGAAGALLGKNRLTWAEPTDPKQKQAFRAAHMQPYSVKIGDNWIGFAKLPPIISYNFALISALDDAQKNAKIGETGADNIMGAVAKYGNFLADQSYVKSVGDMLAAVKGDPEKIATLVSNYPQQLVPERAFSGWFAKMSDETQRQINTNSSFAEKQVESLFQQIPFLRQTTTARVDDAGNPIASDHPVLNAFSPTPIATENPEGRAAYDVMQQRLAATRDKSALTKQAKEAYAKGDLTGVSDKQKTAYDRQAKEDNIKKGLSPVERQLWAYSADDLKAMRNQENSGSIDKILALKDSLTTKKTAAKKPKVAKAKAPKKARKTSGRRSTGRKTAKGKKGRSFNYAAAVGVGKQNFGALRQIVNKKPTYKRKAVQV